MTCLHIISFIALTAICYWAHKFYESAKAKRDGGFGDAAVWFALVVVAAVWALIWIAISAVWWWT